MPQHYFTHTFDNGLTFLAENMPHTQSAAMTLLLPAGSANDPDGKTGSATVLSDLVLRGAGEADSRALTAHLDRLGLQRSTSVGVNHTRFACAAVASQVLAGLSAYGDIVHRPHLPADGFEAGRDLAIQALAGIDDEPRQKLMIKLRESYLPWPYSRNSMGTVEELQALTLSDLKADFCQRYHAGGAILAIAGNVDPLEWKDAIAKAFGDLPGGVKELPPLRTRGDRFCHEEQQSEQTHIGIAYDSIPETNPDYYLIRLAMEVLSGGMSGRLFTEVREKRGLCYSVWAGYSSLKDQGSIFGYAGTSNERAQATLDCMIDEVYRLGEGVTPGELQRAKIGLKANSIMSADSTSSRAGSLAHDWWMRGRLRTLAEIQATIDAITVDQVNAYLKANPPGDMTIVTVGPKPLILPGQKC